VLLFLFWVMSEVRI